MLPEPDECASQCSHAASAAFDLSRATASCGHWPVSDFLSDRMVCHDAVGPNSRCRLGQPILAGSLPDWPGHKATRDPSRPGCLSADDASDPQLASPVLLLCSPFIVLPLLARPSQGIARVPRGRQERSDSPSWCPLPSRIGLMQMRMSGDRRSQGSVHARCPDRVQLRQAASAQSRPLSSAVSAAARPLLAHAETASMGPLGDYWQLA